MSWHLGPMCAFDTETTGVDVDKDRIVTITAAAIVPGQETEILNHLIAVDMDIPDEATKVHGITTEHAQRNGVPAAEALEAVAEMLADAMDADVPVVGMNLSFDFTILDRELRRNGLVTLEARLGREISPVVDIFVIDKAVDRYRRGGRKLTDLRQTYNVRHDGAHDATEDALAAARVAWRIAQQYPQIAAMSLDELHRCQVRWAEEQALSFQQYLYRLANEKTHEADRLRDRDPGRADLAKQDAEQLFGRAEAIGTDWPVRPFSVAGAP